MEVFWKSGYAATSLDDLGVATGMNRPSLYAAFGDKREIYVKAYEKYRARMHDEFRPLVESADHIRLILRKVLEASAEIYMSGPDGARGCLTVVTAASEAVAEPEIRHLVVEAIAALDETLAMLFSRAISRGELPTSADASALGRAAAAMLHTLAIRARAGCSKDEIQRIIDDAVHLICGSAGEGGADRPRP